VAKTRTAICRLSNGLFGGYMGSSGGSTFDELLSWCRDKTLQSLVPVRGVSPRDDSAHPVAIVSQ